MFQIDDNFLSSVGYNVETMSQEQKEQYIEEFTEELNQRVSERLVSELNDQQVEEFNEVQENPSRARSWLDEFHASYRLNDEYRQLVENASNEDEAVVFYATALWMNDAVPKYGELIQEELNSYQAQLVKMRQSANKATGL